jgi:NADP-dependent 3-hydroxy acid dehydrogenase YdfG
MPEKKIILITGGSDGLGKATATLLAPANQVIILASNENKLKLTAGALGVDYVVADITNYEQVENAVKQVLEKYGQIDTVINCAGVWLQGELETNDAAEIAKTINVNLLGTINIAKAVVPSMKAGYHGLIINICSDAGEEHKATKAVYCASKWGVTGFSKSLRDELKSSGVRVTYVMPGRMSTNFFDKAGIEKDLQGALDPAQTADLLKYLVDLPDRVVVPEVRIEGVSPK